MNSRISPLKLEFQPAAGPITASGAGHVLGSITYENGAEPDKNRDASSAGLTIHAPLRSLDADPLAEVWICDREPTLGTSCGFEIARTEKLLFGVSRVDCEDPERAAMELYTSLFRLLTERGFPELLRVWNIVPRIGENRGDIDRYMHFCRGRALAFERHHGRGFESILPAASAVGSSRGLVMLWFLASKWPGTPRENPRQMSAFRYPNRYGPKSPSFARATLAPVCLGAELLLSGTASILGSESVHPGDAESQLRETMENIRALLHDAGRSESRPLQRLKIFVRDRSDLPAIREALAPLRESGTQMLYLKADICRPELLLEIEGVGGPASAIPATSAGV